MGVLKSWPLSRCGPIAGQMLTEALDPGSFSALAPQGTLHRPEPGPRLPSSALENIPQQTGMYTGREDAPSCCTLDASTMRDLFSKEVK